jgi:alkanesulfonate monooxygenase SsuD/methylene tetrahydromethanopterin reductase-like flavin-dependent oxidoreductase (luciferase family)
MQYSISIPNFAENPRSLVELAREAEAAGWNGFFLWDSLLFDTQGVPIVDPWVTLAAIAATTQRIRIGTMVTPLPRRRPWKLARETASLDQLSQGRLILGVGLGEPVQEDFACFGEQTNTRLRAAMLDEGLEVLQGLWSGRPFSYHGEHYQIEEVVFLPTPLQSPRIPIWVGGHWPHTAPMRRAARWDGVNPIKAGTFLPADLREIVTYIKAHRSTDSPFEVVAGGYTPGDDVASWAEAGATWWLEVLDPWRFGWEKQHPLPFAAMHARIHQGPPIL